MKEDEVFPSCSKDDDKNKNNNPEPKTDAEKSKSAAKKSTKKYITKKDIDQKIFQQLSKNMADITKISLNYKRKYQELEELINPKKLLISHPPTCSGKPKMKNAHTQSSSTHIFSSTSSAAKLQNSLYNLKVHFTHTMAKLEKEKAETKKAIIENAAKEQNPYRIELYKNMAKLQELLNSIEVMLQACFGFEIQFDLSLLKCKVMSTISMVNSRIAAEKRISELIVKQQDIDRLIRQVDNDNTELMKNLLASMEKTITEKDVDGYEKYNVEKYNLEKQLCQNKLLRAQFNEKMELANDFKCTSEIINKTLSADIQIMEENFSQIMEKCMAEGIDVSVPKTEITPTPPPIAEMEEETPIDWKGAFKDAEYAVDSLETMHNSYENLGSNLSTFNPAPKISQKIVIKGSHPFNIYYCKNATGNQPKFYSDSQVFKTKEEMAAMYPSYIPTSLPKFQQESSDSEEE